MSSEKGFHLLNKATDALLASVNVSPAPTALWSVRYRQHPSSGSEADLVGDERILHFPPPPMDLAFDDAILDNVKEVWRKIVGDDPGEYLVFQDREVYDDDD